MSTVTITVATPTETLTKDPYQYTFPSGLTLTTFDKVRFFRLIESLKQMFAGGVITTSGDNVTITITGIDGSVS